MRKINFLFLITGTILALLGCSDPDSYEPHDSIVYESYQAEGETTEEVEQTEPYTVPDDEESQNQPPPDATNTEQSGFDSPEAAMVAYVEGLRDDDFNRMLSAFAVETYVKYFDLEAFLERLRMHQFRHTPLPEGNSLTVAMNIELRRGDVFRQIRGQYLVFTLLDQMEDTNEWIEEFREPIEEGGAADFIRELDEIINAPEFHTIEILGFISREDDEMYTSERNQENLARRAKTLGADQVMSRTIVFEMSGDIYFIVADVVNYGDRWYILEMGGNFSSLMGLQPRMHGLIFLPDSADVPPEVLEMFYEELWENLITEW